MPDTIIQSARKAYHQSLVDNRVLSITADGVASNADSSNAPSKEIARLVAEKLGANTGVKLQGQTAGTLFEQITMQFISDTFPLLQHLRPGDWTVLNLGNQNAIKTWDFSQYEHLAYLSQLMNENRQLSTMLGNDYMVAPDVVVYRALYEDNQINQGRIYINDDICKMADLRKSNGGKPILHASISAKWTMRSDRAQNSRTEALNLIRNRKGHLPHIVVVTGEPLPSRLASLALGTGDLDCVYHFALYELLDAVREYGANGREDIIETLENLIDGKRLKDISDLPLDLSV
ncbi:MAG: type II restriction endonuclease [Bacteroidetes bacterium]|nr:type II restriction endonuclease [Bacteroidota bacterium]